MYARMLEYPATYFMVKYLAKLAMILNSQVTC